MYLELLLHLSVYRIYENGVFEPTLLTEDIFLSHCLTTARWLCQRKFPKIIQILEELTLLFNELTSRKRKKNGDS